MAARMAHYPDMLLRLPDADVPYSGVDVRLLRGPGACAIFLEALTDVTVPEHRHGDQWGLVVEGEMRLMIGGENRACHRAESDTIPFGTPHAAKLAKGTRVIDVFDDPDLYRPKP